MSTIENLPLLSKYTKLHREKPHLKSFAPLAELYRKSGKLDEAIAILRSGLKSYPEYKYAKICLARCFFLKEDYQRSYELISPLVDNLNSDYVLLKLYGETCEHLFYYEESLMAFRGLKFFYPKNKELQEKVEYLETICSDQRAQKGELVPVNGFSNLSDWEPLLLSGENEGKTAQKNAKKEDGFSQNDGEDNLKITCSLADLYIEEGHPEKALEILEKIYELNPNKGDIREKINFVCNKFSLNSESFNHLDTISQQLSPNQEVKGVSSEEKQQKILLKYSNFLDLVKERAKTTLFV